MPEEVQDRFKALKVLYVRLNCRIFYTNTYYLQFLYKADAYSLFRIKDLKLMIKKIRNTEN